MTQYRRQPAPRLALALVLLGMSLACDAFPINETDGENEEPDPLVTPAVVETSTPSHLAPTVPSEDALADVWSLWVDGPHLRGANIYQRRVYSKVDGTELLGEGPIGPPFTQQDFDRLAALGANYVNLSHPGPFTEDEPYALDPQVQQNLDHLLAAAAQADLFAVISLPTGAPRTICAAHQYAPHPYTPQWTEDGEFSYPGEMDTDELMDVIVGYWARNAVRPSNSAEPTMDDCRTPHFPSQQRTYPISCDLSTYLRRRRDTCILTDAC